MMNFWLWRTRCTEWLLHRIRTQETKDRSLLDLKIDFLHGYKFPKGFLQTLDLNGFLIHLFLQYCSNPYSRTDSEVAIG